MRTLLALLFGGVAAMAPVAAPAGTLDHLLCYRMADPLRMQFAADLLADLQPEFTQRGCTLIKAIEFCVPATKTNVTPAPPFPGLSGQTLQNDYVCYKTRCQTTTPPPNKLVTDQFGARVQRRYVVSKICVPAKKEPAPCAVTGPRMCGGTCPNPNQRCVPDPVDRGCTCLPVAQGCFVNSTGTCTGTCPTAGVQCMFDNTGHCGCPCAILIPNGQTNVCQAGVCPSPKVCVKNTTDTACVCCATGGVACSVTSDCCVPYTCIGGVCS